MTTLRPRSATLLSALLVWALAGLVGCEDSHTLLLEVSAESRVDQYDLLVQDVDTGELVLEITGQAVDKDHPDRDISVPGQALRLKLDFDRPGDYLVHLVGRSDAAPQIASRVFTVHGKVKRHLTLVSLAGTDADGDTFLTAEECLALEAPDVDCTALDCDGGDPAVHPLAPEICGNAVDENCDGDDLLCVDADGDGSPENLDCDDNDPERYPGAVEAINRCPSAEHPEGVENPQCDDGIDQDCDGQDLACVVDDDCDEVPAELDCDDQDPAVRPGAVEVCANGIDDNCDGRIDEGCVACDLDGDGFERLDPVMGCSPGPGSADCDDFDSGVHPLITQVCGGLEGGDPACAALQMCDGRDNDCDGEVDEGCPPIECDQDRDGFMNASPGCDAPPDLVDCDDASPLVYPGAPDRCGDGFLQNCTSDSVCGSDADGDGYNASVDCDDANPGVYPGAVEICDGVDNDCDGVVDEGNPDPAGERMVDVHCNDDGDGMCGAPEGAGRCVCAKVVPTTQRDPAGRVSCPGEDLGALASPRCFFAPQPTIERCDAKDHDCDGAIDDPAGVHLLEVGDPCGADVGACVAGTVLGCDYSQSTPGALNEHFLCSADFVGPTAEECNGLDDDCDGVLETDEQDPDGDGYLACTGCPSGPLGLGVLGCDDCDPTAPEVYPGAPELCDGRDNDCAGLGDDGADECGGAHPECCGEYGVCVDPETDLTHCGGCGQRCDSLTADRCEAGSCSCGGGDECAFDRTCEQGQCLCFGVLSPGPEASCDDGLDNDCDGLVDCTDGDCEGESCDASGICTNGSCVY